MLHQQQAPQWGRVLVEHIEPASSTDVALTSQVELLQYAEGLIHSNTFSIPRLPLMNLA